MEAIHFSSRGQAERLPPQKDMLGSLCLPILQPRQGHLGNSYRGAQAFWWEGHIHTRRGAVCPSALYWKTHDFPHVQSAPTGLWLHTAAIALLPQSHMQRKINKA